MLHGTKLYFRNSWGGETRRKLKVFRYRQDPVPGIHTFKGNLYGCWRNFKFMQEKREYCKSLYDLQDFKFKLRATRSHKNLLDSWDDVRMYQPKKSWKRTKKKKQWMS